MAFSFSNWFKKPAEGAATEGTAVAPSPAATAPASPAPTAPTPARPLKTAVPNSVRPINLREGTTRPAPAPAAPASRPLRSGPSAVPGAAGRAIAFPGLTPVAPIVPTPVAPAARTAPARGPVPTPAPDATVTVPLGEFFDRVPSNLLRPGATVDRARPVVFQAADLYSDLARGRASVPVSAVQAACPDLFNRAVSPTEDVEVVLPLPRIIEQLAGTFQARPDQIAEEDVAEIETPFLQVALEDSMRLPKPPTAPAPVIAPLRPATPVAPPPPAPSPLAVHAPAIAPVASGRATTVPARVVASPRPTPTAPHTPTAPAITPLAPPTRDSVAPINPATKRPPSTVRASVAGGKIRLSGPAISSRSIAPAAAHSAPAPLALSALPPAAVRPVTMPSPVGMPPSAAAAVPAQKKTARIQIPPIALRPGGAPAAPAAPRPVAPGSPSPRSVAFPEPLVSFRATPGDAAAPGPIPPPPFAPGAPRQLPPSGTALRPGTPAPLPTPPAFPAVPPPPMPPFAPVISPTPLLVPAAPAAPAAYAAEDDAKINFALAPILRTLPDTMFAENLDGYAAAEQVPDGARVELPLGFITAQLTQGRVVVPRAMFVAAMPEECRRLIPAEGEPAEVLIPLQEVFQNLPTGALSRRHDQVSEEVGPEIPTPFSQKAQEDAQRLAAPAPEPPPAAEPEPAVAPAAEVEEPVVAVTTELEPEPEPEPAPVVVEAVEETHAPVAELTHAPVESVEVQSAEPTLEVATPETETSEQPVAVEEAPEVNAEPTVTAEEETAPVAAAEAETPAVLEAEPEAVSEPELQLEPEPETEPELESKPEPEPEPEGATASAPALETTAEPPADGVEEAPAEPRPESAARLELPAAPEPTAEETVVAEPESLSVPAPEPAPAVPEPALSTNGQHSPVSEVPVPAISLEESQEALRSIFMVDDDLDAKKIVRLITELPGLKACTVMFGDGLKLAGDLDGLSRGEGFSAMTPPFFRRVRAYATELSLGETQCVSLQTERALLSFFMSGEICLSVQHAGNRSFLPGVREKLLATTAELARMYAMPAATR